MIQRSSNKTAIRFGYTSSSSLLLLVLLLYVVGKRFSIQIATNTTTATTVSTDTTISTDNTTIRLALVAKQRTHVSFCSFLTRQIAKLFRPMTEAGDELQSSR
jgi:hypothetical protein